MSKTLFFIQNKLSLINGTYTFCTLEHFETDTLAKAISDKKLIELSDFVLHEIFPNTNTDLGLRDLIKDSTKDKHKIAPYLNEHDSSIISKQLNDLDVYFPFFSKKVSFILSLDRLESVIDESYPVEIKYAISKRLIQIIHALLESSRVCFDITYINQNPNSFASQLARILLKKFCHHPSFEESLPVEVKAKLSPFSLKSFMYTRLDSDEFCQLKLKELYFYKSSVETMIGLDLGGILCPDFLFGLETDRILDLEEIFKHLKSNYEKTFYSEPVIILKTKLPLNQEFQEKIHQLILDTKIFETCQVHFLILTEDDALNYTLPELAPKKEDLEKRFAPLAHDKGWYLSSSELFVSNSESKKNHFRRCAKPKSLIETKPDLSPPLTYIRTSKTESSPNRRASKHDKKTLQLNSNANMNAQSQISQDFSHQQVLSAELTHSTQSINSQQQVKFDHSFSLFDSYVNFDDFLKILKDHAKMTVEYHSHKKAWFSKNSIITEHFKQNYFWAKILNDEEFRFSLATRVFSMGYTQTPSGFKSIYVENVSIDLIKKDQIKFVLQYLPIVDTGIKLLELVDEYRFFYTIGSKKKIIEFNLKSPPKLEILPNWGISVFFDGLFPSPFIHSSSTATHGYQSFFNWRTFFSKVELDELSENDKEVAKKTATELLEIFNYSQLSQEEFIQFKEKYITFFTQFYQQEHYSEILRTLFTYFKKPSPDYLKSLIYLCISGGRPTFIKFLECIEYLEHYQLLKTFCVIFFQNADHISLLVNQFNYPTFFASYMSPEKSFFNDEERYLIDFTNCNSSLGVTFFDDTEYLSTGHREFPNHLFFKFLKTYTEKITHGESHEEIHFLCKFLEYISKSNLLYTNFTWGRLNRYLPSILEIITPHYGSEANNLFKKLLYSLTSEDEGLRIKSGIGSFTFMNELEFLVTHTSSKGTLKEQIENFQDLSFQPYDAPYAFKHNQYAVISPEMEIYASKLDPVTKSYYVSRTDLEIFLGLLTRQQDLFKRTIFRYLGSELLRESITFYQQLFQKAETLNLDNNPQQQQLINLILGFIVLKTTDIHYQSELNYKLLFEEFSLKLRNHPNVSFVPDQIRVLFEHILSFCSKLPNDASENTTTLWQLWLQSKPEILSPSLLKRNPIFTFKFKQSNFVGFIHQYQELILSELTHLNNHPLLIKRIWELLFNTTKASKDRLAISLIKKLYAKEINLDELIVDIKNIQYFITLFHELNVDINYNHNVYSQLKELIQPSFRFEQAFQILKLLIKESSSFHPQSYCCFLEIWRKYPNIRYAKFIEGIFQALVKHNTLHLDHLNTLFFIINQHINAELDQICTYSSIMISAFKTPSGFYFFEKYKAISPEIQNLIFKIINLTQCNATVFQTLDNILQQANPILLLEQLEIEIRVVSYSENHILASLEIWNLYPCATLDFLILNKIIELPLINIQQLQRLLKFKYINSNDLVDILNKENISQTIQKLEQEIFERQRHKNLTSFTEVEARLNQISIKNDSVIPYQPLTKKTYSQLTEDYKKMIGMLYDTPVFIDSDDPEKKSYVISQLTQTQIYGLFQHIKKHIHQSQFQQYYTLILMSLGCEVLFRTLGKFPRDTQLMTVLISLHQPGHLIHEMKTGEGKSISSALCALLLSAQGFSVDMITKNATLAQNILDTFSPFFNYFGISTGQHLIQMHSITEAYQHQGINFSTTSDLALFRLQQQLELHPIPKKIALIWDEVDAELTSSVDFRLASVINPAFYNKKQSKELFTLLLDFVMDEELFTENYCSSAEDIENFKIFCRKKGLSQETKTFLSSLSDDYLELFIESATVALKLESGKDYVIVTQTEQGKQYSYAAPYLDSSKRPDPRLSFADAIQQILHLKLQKDASKLAPFKIEEITETLISMNAKNFFDSYHLNDGRVLSFTGTAGSSVELKEFHDTHGLITYHYPTFHKDQSQDLGFKYCFGSDAHSQLILDTFLEFRQVSTQPILIITSTPAETEKNYAFIRQHSTHTLQFFIGDESNGVSEDDLIKKAGQANANTISNQSLARGTDIITEHPDGLLVINTCADITLSDLEQIQGRAARNGKKGQFISLLDASQFKGTALDTPEILRNKFHEHQLNLSYDYHTKRLQSRLLNDVRYLILSRYLLKLRIVSEPILQGQFGTDYCLVEYQKVIDTLFKFNQKLEKLYAKLQLEKSNLDELQQAFLESTVLEYQAILNDWVPANKFEHFEVIEPLIPIDYLKILPRETLVIIKAEQLVNLSQALSQLWLMLGHRNVAEGLKQKDQLSRQFSALMSEQEFKFSSLLNFIFSNQFISLAELEGFAQTLKTTALELNQYTQDIPLLGHYIPRAELEKGINDYFNETLHHIHHQEWDNLALPKLNLDKIKQWFKTLGHIQQGIAIVTTVSSFVAGPIPFLIKKILMPIITKWCTVLFKKTLKLTDSKIAQLIVGVTEITDHILALYELLNSKKDKLKIKDYLAACSDLLQNKAFTEILTYVFQSYKFVEFAQVQQFLELVIKHLEPYQNLSLSDLKNPEIILPILEKSIDPIIKTNADNNKYFLQVHKILQAFTPDMLQAIQQLNFQNIFCLLELISHPQFTLFIQGLPKDSNLLEVLNYTETPLEMLPQNLHQSFQKLFDYQHNQQRREQEFSQFMQSLHKNFTLTPEKLALELITLTPKPVIDLAYEAPWSSVLLQHTYQFLTSKYLLLGLGAGALIYFNIVLFSYQLLACSLLLTLWQGYEWYQNYSKHKNQEKILEPKESPIVISIQAQL